MAKHKNNSDTGITTDRGADPGTGACSINGTKGACGCKGELRLFKTPEAAVGAMLSPEFMGEFARQVNEQVATSPTPAPAVETEAQTTPLLVIKKSYDIPQPAQQPVDPSKLGPLAIHRRRIGRAAARVKSRVK